MLGCLLNGCVCYNQISTVLWTRSTIVLTSAWCCCSGIVLLQLLTGWQSVTQFSDGLPVMHLMDYCDMSGNGFDVSDKDETENKVWVEDAAQVWNCQKSLVSRVSPVSVLSV
jgi:hypothetical protein